jgi:hypothetical protein
MDNINLKVLMDTYHHLCLNYLHISAYNYNCGSTNFIGLHLQNAVKDLNPEVSGLTINNFQNLLHFKEVVPHLDRLLQTREIRTINCEAAFGLLVKCCIEQV